MGHPKAVGETSQLAIMLALDRVGYPVFVPLGENTRYDLVIDEGARLARVQCKTGRLRGGSVRFKACSSYAHHPNPKILKRDYVDEIDYFAVYCVETEAVYLIPVEAVPTRWECALRVEPTRNSQRRRIRSASDYEIARVSARATGGPGGRPGAGGSYA
jgi:PD-(D/E)XK endonuclease